MAVQSDYLFSGKIRHLPDITNTISNNLFSRPDIDQAAFTLLLPTHTSDFIVLFANLVNSELLSYIQNT